VFPADLHEAPGPRAEPAAGDYIRFYGVADLEDTGYRERESATAAIASPIRGEPRKTERTSKSETGLIWAATKGPGPKPAASADIGSDSVIGLLAGERRRVGAVRCRAIARSRSRAPSAAGRGRACSSCLGIAACCPALCRWKCSSTVSGRVRKGRCPAINAGRLRVREPEVGPSWRDAERGSVPEGRAPFRQRATVSSAREPGCRALAREPRLAEGGEVDDRAADQGRGDLERALAGGDRGEDVGVAR
jgi:hypothetical protein